MLRAATERLALDRHRASSLAVTQGKACRIMEDWTKQRLQQLVTDRLCGVKLIAVSNCEPYIRTREAGGIQCRTPASGLTTAIDPILRASRGVWVAHGSGSADRDVVGPTRSYTCSTRSSVVHASPGLAAQTNRGPNWMRHLNGRDTLSLRLGRGRHPAISYRRSPQFGGAPRVE